jgi:hypothetical protein
VRFLRHLRQNLFERGFEISCSFCTLSNWGDVGTGQTSCFNSSTQARGRLRDHVDQTSCFNSSTQARCRLQDHVDQTSRFNGSTQARGRLRDHFAFSERCAGENNRVDRRYRRI